MHTHIVFQNNIFLTACCANVKYPIINIMSHEGIKMVRNFEIWKPLSNNINYGCDICGDKMWKIDSWTVSVTLHLAPSIHEVGGTNGFPNSSALGEAGRDGRRGACKPANSSGISSRSHGTSGVPVMSRERPFRPMVGVARAS